MIEMKEEECEMEMTAKNRELTASEAADRVAARWRAMTEDERERFRDGDPDYTCEACGHHQFYMEWTETVSTEFENSVPCTCDEENEYAYRVVYREILTNRVMGILDEVHRLCDEERDEVDRDTEEVESEVQCHKCNEDATELDWESDYEDADSEIENDDFYVRCSGCNHEIEFGWSHPDRGGRIWPCESNDHNPYKSWPEPRYRDAWAQRGWLRPQD